MKRRCDHERLRHKTRKDEQKHQTQISKEKTLVKCIGQERNVCAENFQNQRTEYVGSSWVGKQEWDVNKVFRVGPTFC